MKYGIHTMKTRSVQAQRAIPCLLRQSHPRDNGKSGRIWSSNMSILSYKLADDMAHSPTASNASFLAMNMPYDLCF